MSTERRKVLDMLAQGKISVEDAERLLSALSGDEPAVDMRDERSSRRKSATPRFLRIMVEPGEEGGTSERVNIRVPLRLVRAGLKWASFIPKEAQEKVNESLKRKGIEMDFTKMTQEDLDELIGNLNEFTVDVEGDEHVRIFCE
jgi:hypothetical protein